MPRALSAALLIVLTLGSIAAVALLLRGRELAEQFIRFAAARSGTEVHGLTVESVGLGTIVLGPLRLGGDDGPSASNVHVEWGLAGLLGGQLDRIRIENLQLGLAVRDGELVVSGLPTMGGSNGGAPLSVKNVDVPDARIRLVTELGRATVSLATSLRWKLNGEASGTAALDALIEPKNGPDTRVTAAMPALRLARDDGRLVVETVGAEVALPKHGVALSGIAVTGSIAPDPASATLRAELRDLSTPARWRPVKIALDGGRAGGEVTFSGRAESSDRALTATIRGSHDLASRRGAATIEAAPVRFGPGERLPSDLLAALVGGPHPIGGAVSARSVLSWSGQTFSQSHIAVLDGVRLESGIIQVSALSGRLTFDSLAPLRTPAPQRLRADVQIASLPPGHFDLLFSLNAGNRLRINEAGYEIAGGTLALVAATIEPGRPLDTALEIRAVDLGALLGLIGVEGLSGSGALDGRIPVHVAANGVAIRDGRIAAKGRGVVRYAGAGLQGAIAAADTAAGDTLKLLQDALADFHYTEMTMTLDRSVTGDGSLLIHLKGANPAVLDGHPFNLNIRLETNFDRLATIFIAGYAAATDLLKGSIGR